MKKAFWILAALAVFWFLMPALLGFSGSQATRWSRVTGIPEVLSEVWMERTGSGRIIITHDDGSKTVISTNRNGETTSVKTFSADGVYLFDYAAAKRDLHNWREFQADLKAG